MIKEYIKTYTNKNNNINEKDNNNKDINLTPKKSIEEQKKDFGNLLKTENINNFSLYNHKNNNKNAFTGNLKRSSEDDFVIYKSYDMSKDIGKDKKNKNIKRSDDNEGKLSFNNDDEILNYIKRKIKEEKENEYYNGKMKYNYFILTKKFHGKVLYEIGLENDLNEINNILRKENVEVEHEPVAFITLKELDQLKDSDGYKEIERLKNDNLKLKEEIENLNQENKKLQKELDIMNYQNKKFNNKNNDENEKLKEEIEKMNKENEKLKKRLDIKNKNLEDNNSLVNDLNKLTEEIEQLKEKNNSIENKLNEKQNLIDEYEKKLKEKEKGNENENEARPQEKEKEKEKEIDDKENENIREENKKLKDEREKFIKYINELQAYDEKVILEYQKVKKQLQIELQKNNLNNNNPINPKKYFTNDELGIISNEIINILAQKKHDKKESEEKNNLVESHEVINSKPEEKNELIQKEKEENKNDINNELKEEKLDSNSKEKITENKEGKKLLKNEDYLDENKKKNKVGFSEKEKEVSPAKNKREESMKKAMKRLENKRKRDSEFEEKKKLRKSEKISGLAQQLERTLKKGEGRIYVDEEYEKHRQEEEEEENDDNFNQ